MTNEANSPVEVTLLPCPNPWCHSHDRSLPLTSIGIAERNMIYGRIGFVARCSDCGVSTRVESRKDDAYRVWNSRPTVDNTALIEALRGALITCGRAAGCFLADEVSDDFLMLVPAEVEAKLAALSTQKSSS